MRYETVIAAFHATPWAILPEKLDAIRLFLARKAAGEEIPPEEIAEVLAARRDGAQAKHGSVAVVPIYGVLAQRVGLMGQSSGGVSTEQIGAQIDQLAADPAVRTILLSIDSPGGSVYGVEELAAKIRALRDTKRIVAVANSVAASAAYWIAAQANEVVVTPGGQVGSIGVLAVHQDTTRAERKVGIKTTVVSAGKYKAELDPSLPLTEEGRAELQSKVDHYYRLFVAAVSKGRNVTEHRVEKDFGEGRMVTAKDAVSRGMADRVGTLEQTIDRYGGLAKDARLAAIRARAVEVEESE